MKKCIQIDDHKLSLPQTHPGTFSRRVILSDESLPFLKLYLCPDTQVPSALSSLNLRMGGAKALGFDDRKRHSIRNTKPLTIVEIRQLSRSQNERYTACS